MKVLLVVDMQYDFIHGALGSEEAQAIVPNVIEKIKECAADNRYAIVYTRDTHYPDYMESNEGKHLPVPHCVSKTLGWEIHDHVSAASDGAVYVEKLNKYSFGMEDIGRMLATIPEVANGLFDNTDVESIEIVGLCTDICVVSNALILKAAFPEIPMTVYGDCCAGTSVDAHEAALKVMQMCQIEVR
jgi:nicotinamidase-related amidase